eukprot:925245-Pelagomonas_calceolata.AAC.21
MKVSLPLVKDIGQVPAAPVHAKASPLICTCSCARQGPFFPFPFIYPGSKNLCRNTSTYTDPRLFSAVLEPAVIELTLEELCNVSAADKMQALNLIQDPDRLKSAHAELNFQATTPQDHK